ncbi:multidrug resistance protein D [Legionella nautarum]|uniref:Bcr/CflA family efflux transporter n=1 Tax=Legionella nautarum TaxID=45070 RepID=A0A0W0WRX1_9GAMM|nr:Bcr/CflA family efflux MFS transporter [Legionella nautarum]KTD35063.1 multidrug resistance protein D [Legionella nautarum]
MHNKTTSVFYLGALAAFSLLTFDLFQPSLPTITTYFHTWYAISQLTLSLYCFSFGLAQLIWGPLIDYYGRKKSLALSFWIFLLATLICIFSINIELLLLGRIIQGFSVCCANVVAFSSARDLEDENERTKLLSYLLTIIAISPIFAPLLGSIVHVQYGWRAVFVLMGLIGFLLLLLANYFLYESPYWVQQKGNSVSSSALDKYGEVVSHRRIWIGTIIITATFTCMLLMVLNAPYLMIEKMSFSPVVFSLLFAINGFVLIASNLAGIQLRKKYSIAWNFNLGSFLMIFGSVAMLYLFYLRGLTLFTLSLTFFISFGLNLVSPPALSYALTDYREDAGTATALINTIRTIVATVFAVLISILVLRNVAFLAVGFLICSALCWLFTLFCKD